jgi:predicted amidohydrolase
MGHYRKHYPTAGERQALSTLPGTAYPIFRLGDVRLGINICADSRQLDTIDALAEQGVQVVHNPHANYLSLGRNPKEWTRGKLVYYLQRVIHCRAHFLINNLAGTATDSRGVTYHYSGGAMILDPLGQVVARTTSQRSREEMVVATLDTELEHFIPEFERRRIGL